jgi:hypothetical protein
MKIPFVYKKYNAYYKRRRRRRRRGSISHDLSELYNPNTQMAIYKKKCYS